MNCGRSSSVEWKLPKLQRRVRFPSPAPLPPSRAPGGFVMPASRPPSTECGGTIGAKLSPRKLGALCSGTKLAQHAPHAGIFGIKLALHAQNGLIWRVLPSLGEFYPAFVANKPSRANFLPHKPQHHHGHERNNTPTQHSKPRGETFTAPARHKQPKITHFHHAGANFLSQHPPPTQHAPTPGRTFFQPPASRPSQPTVACNSTPPHPTTTSQSAESQQSGFAPRNTPKGIACETTKALGPCRGAGGQWRDEATAPVASGGTRQRHLSARPTHLPTTPTSDDSNPSTKSRT